MSPYANPKDPRLEEKQAKHRKWQRHPDGLFHCSDVNPGCTFTHKRAASVGRHTITHTGAPYAHNTKADGPGPRNPNAKRLGRPPKETIIHASSNGTNPNPEFDHTRFFLAGSILEQIKSAARALNCTEGELTSGIFQILRATAVR